MPSDIRRHYDALPRIVQGVNRRRLPPFHCSDILVSGGPDGGPAHPVQQTDELLRLGLRLEEHGVSSDRHGAAEGSQADKEFRQSELGYTLICLERWRPPSSCGQRTPVHHRLQGSGVGPAPTEPGCGPDDSQGRKRGPISTRGAPQLDGRSNLFIDASAPGCRDSIGTFAILVHGSVLHRSA